MKYSLVGVNGNAFSIIAYVKRALKNEGFNHLVEKYIKDATSGDYNHLLIISDNMIDFCNQEATNSHW